MLEKNKDYIEFSMWSYIATHKPGQCTDINITGISPEPGVLCTNNPFDIPCDVVVVSKRAFDRLQADNQHYRELAKQREEDYNLLLKKTGFDTVESLVFYLTNIGKHDTLLEVLASLRDQAKYTYDEWKDMKKKLEECEKDYISERDKAETLDKENEELKKKLTVPDPFAEYKELLEKLHSKEDVEKFEWTLNHVCGGQASVNGWMVTAKLWRRNYETLSKLVGFSSVEEARDYLTNEAECDTLHEAISKLKDQVKYTCDEWYSANSRNNSWKAAAECNSPKELIEKLKLLRDDISGHSTVIESYKRNIEKWQNFTGYSNPEDYIRAKNSWEAKTYANALQEWKEATGCPSPSAAKTMIESQASWCHAYNEVKEKNEKLGEIIKSWKNVTGYSNPEVYMQARISGTFNTPFDYTAAWQKATGFDRPETFLKWKTDIEGIMEAWKLKTGCTYPGEAGRLLEKWKTMTKCETPEAAATWITSYKSACERGNKLARDIENWRNVTGYSTPEEYTASKILTVASTYNVEKEWKEATGCETPKVAYVAMDGFKELIKKKEEEINELRSDYSHLLLTTGFESEGEIEDALDKCDHSTLRKALVDYEFDYEALLKLTGYKSEGDIRDMLRGEKRPYQTMRDLINSLRRKARWNL